jgi:hypothetical protein
MAALRKVAKFPFTQIERIDQDPPMLARRLTGLDRPEVRYSPDAPFSTT